MTEYLPTILSFICVVIAIVWSVKREANRPSIQTREQILEEQVTKLESLVENLRYDRTVSQNQINDLRKELDVTKAEIIQLRARISVYESMSLIHPDPVQEVKKDSSKKILLAVIGEEPMFQTDLAALRKVESKNDSIKVSRVYPATQAGLKRMLNRHRVSGAPIKWIHIGTHASPQGVMFGNEVVTGQWLSENMSDVQILFINGCRGDEVADWAGIVPFVISLTENIENTDAALFCEAFWQGVSENLSPDDAFYRAIKRVPSISEFAELHI